MMILRAKNATLRYLSVKMEPLFHGFHTAHRPAIPHALDDTGAGGAIRRYNVHAQKAFIYILSHWWRRRRLIYASPASAGHGRLFSRCMPVKDISAFRGHYLQRRRFRAPQDDERASMLATSWWDWRFDEASVILPESAPVAMLKAKMLRLPLFRHWLMGVYGAPGR